MESATRLVPLEPNSDPVTFDLWVEGKEISNDYRLINITVHNEINRIPTASLVILDGEPNDEKFPISDSGDFLPGKKIEVRLGYDNDNKTVFKGIIITNTLKVNINGSELMVECKDETIKMTVNKGNRQFNDVSDSDVITRLLDDNKVSGFSVENTEEKHEQLVQSNKTDWDYMISRIDINAMICVISNAQLKVRRPNMIDDAKVVLMYGLNILEFHADMDARTQTAAVKTLSWDFANQKVITTESEDSGAAEDSALSQHETQTIANAKKLRQDLSNIKGKVKYQGITNALPGDFITISGAAKNFNGRAFVSAIKHEYGDGNWVTEATLGLNEQFFAEQTNPGQGASHTGHSSFMHGLQTGIVTGITDNNGQYRVKIRLPMVNDQDEGIFARVATLDAGDKRGTFFRPEVDDEVVVGFMNDDASNPVILGMLHSSTKSAPLEPAAANPEKGYVSRNGIRLIFNDDKHSVLIQTPGSCVFEMNDQDNSITVKDKNGNKIVMDQNGISIESVADLKIKAGTSISIEAPQLTLKARGTMSVESTGNTSISSNGITDIKGSMVKIN